MLTAVVQTTDKKINLPLFLAEGNAVVCVGYIGTLQRK